ASFLIDWVRVYQDSNDSTHSIGCSTGTHPTSKWITGHSERYKDPEDHQLLVDVRRGGGHCKADMDCGTRGGRCSGGRCHCTAAYMGPWC
ncbi:unnamed protein product, partial [Phaeothamnion confervicola]